MSDATESAKEEITRRARETASLLGVEVEILDTAEGLTGRRARAKGWFDPKTGRITIVAGNHRSAADIQATLLHEAVAHYGLRKLFGEHFDTFLDNVFANASAEVRRGIMAYAARHNTGFRVATEEYLASLAETTDFERAEKSGWWQRIKDFFTDMLRKAGIDLGTELTDNELRYILWRSYRNLQEPASRQGILGQAADIAKQSGLGVGNYAERRQEATVAADKGADSGELEAVNARFNDDLSNLTDENADRTVLWLGRPSAVLRSAGVKDKAMKLYGNKVIKKMKKHGFVLSDLRDLPRAVANPIAVFDNYGKDDNRSILTELSIGNKHILVSLTIGKNGVDADFNIVSSVFGKGSSNITDWINKKYATYINKEKALRYLNFSKSSILEASDMDKLSSAANIVENFDNPNIEADKKEDTQILFRDDTDPIERVSVRDSYEKAIAGSLYQAQEAFQDSKRQQKMSNTNEAGLNPIYPFDAEHSANVVRKLESAKYKLKEVSKKYSNTTALSFKILCLIPK